MRAAVLRKHGEPLAIEDVPRPDPDPDGVVVETDACGICRSDWHVWRGEWDWVGAQAQPGQILGHEPAGVVAAVGDEVETLREGDRVTAPFTLGDGTCRHCTAGRGNVCENLRPLGFAQVAQGAFAEAFHLPAADHNAVPLPPGLDPVEMAGLGCRFVTAYRGLAQRTDVGEGDWVAVHGCGGVGLSAVHVADALGANVVAVDIREGPLEEARRIGAKATVDAEAVESPVHEVKGLTDGGAHVSVDALGLAETCRNSVRCLASGGTHVQIGLTTREEAGEVPLPTDAMVMKEVSFVTAYSMPPDAYGDLLTRVQEGALDPGLVVSETVGLERVSEKLEAMTDYETDGIPVVTGF
jgi:alcohol dehydrogenase